MTRGKKNPHPVLGKLSPVTNPLKKKDLHSLEQAFVDHLEFSLAKDRFSATRMDYYKCAALVIRDFLFERWIETQQTYYRKDAKRVYYQSVEYMIGRMLGNAMLNLGLEGPFREALWELGLNIENLEEMECDAGLGNGGLGRLAACFLDSMATMELPAYGYGIRYEYGIFSQKIQDGCQVEAPDHWLSLGYPWEIERPEFKYPVRFYGRCVPGIDEKGDYYVDWQNTDQVQAVAYDVPVPGYKNNTVNNLRLWSAKSSEEFNLQYFNHGDYGKAVHEQIYSEIISKILYPRDDFLLGRFLRLKQEYFMASATLQDIIRRFKKAHKSFNRFPEKVVIQLNDTHPVLAIPELMRILVDQERIPWERAWEISNGVFAYTNHTILSEALETWRVKMLEELLPRHLQILNEINRRFLDQIRLQYPGDEEKVRRVSLFDENEEKRVRMANLAILGSHSVNGVAKLHTKILREEVFSDFYEFWPDKFNNKTNGITPRRWLRLCNPGLSGMITSRIGDEWITDLKKIAGIRKYANSPDFLSEWKKVKVANKKHLADYIGSTYRITVDPDSMFDCQTKRIHEYKRQLMNIMHVIWLYQRLKAGNPENLVPRTVIFSGKAAAAYERAKQIIRLINAVAEIVNNDRETSKWLKVIFLPEYSVSLAQLIVPAAELSEQISTAGMEASGTGNMKYALNGALTIGTLDGANIEIRKEVGDDNIFIFGMTSDEVSAMRREGYDPKRYYDSNPDLKHVLDAIANGNFSQGNKDLFRSLIDDLLNRDYYMVMADFGAYIEAQKHISEVYRDHRTWTRMSVMNTAGMGYFSSDRTIEQYAKDIWKVRRYPISLKKEGK
jgi:starch phosphorylase